MNDHSSEHMAGPDLNAEGVMPHRTRCVPDARTVISRNMSTLTNAGVARLFH
jgi:hypothetical protein